MQLEFRVVGKKLFDILVQQGLCFVVHRVVEVRMASIANVFNFSKLKLFTEMTKKKGFYLLPGNIIEHTRKKT